MKKFSFFLLTASAMVLSCNDNTSSANITENAKDSSAILADTLINNSPAITNAPGAFTKEVAYKNIKFIVTSPSLASGNSFTITPSGYRATNEPMVQSINGKVTDVLIDDITSDNWPEVAVIVEKDTAKAADVFVFSSNANKSFSMVNLPDILQDKKVSALYGGHDEYNFIEGSFVHRFPVYKDKLKTGKYYQVQYKIKDGEAMKQLVRYKSFEF
jgi:hypothetical protein